MTTEVKLDIEGMTCGHCADTVKAEIMAIEGVIECAVAWEDGSAVIQYDERKTNVSAIHRALDDWDQYKFTQK